MNFTLNATAGIQAQDSQVEWCVSRVKPFTDNALPGACRGLGSRREGRGLQAVAIKLEGFRLALLTGRGDLFSVE